MTRKTKTAAKEATPAPAEASAAASRGVSIRIEDLSVRYGEIRAVEDVNLKIRAGEMFILLGPSGCGKTSLLRAVAGFVELHAGRVQFDGRRIDTLPPYERNTGMVFQNYALWPHMSVAQNVAYGLEVRKLPRDEIARRVAEILKTVGLKGFDGRRPGELSGGQQQRVALARALVIRPDVVLLDEPLSNLDAQLRSEMRKEIRSIVRETGVTALYVTHDQREGLSMADRIAIMHEGRIVQAGPPGEVYRYPKTAFAASFLGEANRIDGKVLRSDETALTVSSPLGELHLPAQAAAGLLLTSGKRVPLFVRPESVRLGRSRREDMVRFKAVVGEAAFQGENAHFLLVVKMDSGDVLTLSALQYNPRGVVLEVGREVNAFIEPVDIGIIGASPPGLGDGSQSVAGDELND